MEPVEPQLPPMPGDWSSEYQSNTQAWTIGDLWIDWSAGRYAVQVTARHCNDAGGMHGGAIATFLDGQALILVKDLPPGQHIPTISLQIDYLAPVLVGDWLVAEVEHVKTTRSMHITRALAKVGDRVVARANAIYSNTNRKDPR